jgi:G3E family GTPase
MQDEHKQNTQEQPIAVTVMTGFLGSGKTTLLNGLLHAVLNRRIALIVNEFGAVGIDGATIHGGEYSVELDNGCLCCALNKDLETTLHDICNRGHFDNIIIETTGLAEPNPIAWVCSRPGLSQRLRVDSIVTVFAADSHPRLIEEYVEAKSQLKDADIVVLTKLDLVDDGGQAAEKQIRTHNVLAPIIRAEPGNVPWNLLFDVQATRTMSDALTAHHHAHNTINGGFTSVSVEMGHDVDEDALQAFLEQVPDNVFRIKGFVHTNAPWGWTLINVVAGRIELRPQTPQGENWRSTLVFIGKHINVDALKSACAALPQNNQK